MKLSRDIIMKVFSYIDNETIKKIEMPYEYYKQYLIQRNVSNKREIWYKGIYNNLYNRCFSCEHEFNNDLYLMIICFDCEMLLDNYCNYPIICIKCFEKKNIKRGKIYISSCPSCKDNKMHVAITPYS